MKNNIPFKRRLKNLVKDWQRECNPIWQKYGSWRSSYLIKRSIENKYTISSWWESLSVKLKPINHKYELILKDLGIAGSAEYIQSILSEPKIRNFKGRVLARLCKAAKKQNKLVKLTGFRLALYKHIDLRTVEFV